MAIKGLSRRTVVQSSSRSTKSPRLFRRKQNTQMIYIKQYTEHYKLSIVNVSFSKNTPKYLARKVIRPKRVENDASARPPNRPRPRVTLNFDLLTPKVERLISVRGPLTLICVKIVFTSLQWRFWGFHFFLGGGTQLILSC